MGTPSVTNILKSGAITWLATKGTAFPNPDSIGAGVDWGGSWARIGYTKEPTKLAYEAEYQEANVEEFLAKIRDTKVSEKATIETVLAELTGDYLKLGTHGTLTTTAASVGHVGKEALVIGNTAKVTEYTLGFEGIYYTDSGLALPVRFGFYICSLTLNGELEFSKRSDDYTGVPLQAKASADPANSGRLVYFERVTAPALSA